MTKVAARDDVVTLDVFRSRAVLVGLLVGLPLSTFFLWLAFRTADVGEVWSVLTHARLAPAALAVCAMGGVYTGQAIRWRAIARTPSVSPARFGEMVVSGTAVNNVVPGRVGDLLRARWLQVAAHIPAGRALATVFVDRSFDVLALVVFLTISLPVVASAEWLRRIGLASLALVVTLALVLLAARLYARRRPRGRLDHRGLLRRIARDTVEGLADPLGRLRAVVLGTISIATWLMWALAAWLVAHALDIELSALDALFLTAVINLGTAIPSSPGFIGTYQWLGVSALGLLDIGTERALAFAILMHAVWYVPTTLVGGALLLRRAIGMIRNPSVRPVAMREAQEKRH